MKLTRKLIHLLYLVVVVLFALDGESEASPRIKTIKFAVSNPTNLERKAENIVIKIADLKRIAADFNSGAVIVTATDAATIEEDAAVISATELPSQIDDLDGNNQADELVFQIFLKPNQTRIVSIAYGELEAVSRLRSDYAPKTHARFAAKYEGMGWESDLAAWRIYFDKRNAIDLFGKRRLVLALDTFARPNYDYHEESPIGRDIYKNGDALGLGSVGALVDGKAVKVSDVAKRSWRVISDGPVRAIAELNYEGWKVGGKSVDLTSRITVWANERGFEHQITAKNADGLTIVTGLPRKPGVDELKGLSNGKNKILNTYGHQVLKTGAAAADSLPDQNLGLLIFIPAEFVDNSAKSNDKDNHLAAIRLQNGGARWYVAAAWDQENSEPLVLSPNAQIDAKRKYQTGSLVYPSQAITTAQGFSEYGRNLSGQLANPAKVLMLSAKSAVQSAPPDTLNPAKRKTYAEAIELMRQAVDRNAQKWESVISASKNENIDKEFGFFEQGDQRTGEWQRMKGYSWTGSFWVGELWKLYGKTKDEKYKRWAELWNSRLLGHEMKQNHDVGFLNYLSSVYGYQLTKDKKYLDSALRASERLKQLYNPKTELIASEIVNGDDSIIDTMMNLPLWWWAAKQTKNSQWRELGLKHALKSAKWLVRADGSTIQSVHYNPGDDRKEIALFGVKIPNTARSGEIIMMHTHQGFAADTTWSRGTGWALYGFSIAYAETKDKRMLETAEKIALYVLDRLPEDGVPWYDFVDEGVHFRNRDTSAAALIAGGLLRLSEVAPDKQKAALYRREGERITQSLIDRYLTPVAIGDNTPVGILRHASYTRPHDGMMIFADYYLLETLLWLEEKGAKRGN